MAAVLNDEARLTRVAAGVASMTVKVRVTAWVMSLASPNNVKESVPAAAFVVAVKVRMLEPELEGGLNVAVMPAGRLLTERATGPEKPFMRCSDTRMVSLPPIVMAGAT